MAVLNYFKKKNKIAQIESKEVDGVEVGDIFVIFILGALMQATISSSLSSKEPKPIDVYRGKTALKISYVDTIPQDTLVIWK